MRAEDIKWRCRPGLTFVGFDLLGWWLGIHFFCLTLFVFYLRGHHLMGIYGFLPSFLQFWPLLRIFFLEFSRIPVQNKWPKASKYNQLMNFLFLSQPSIELPDLWPDYIYDAGQGCMLENGNPMNQDKARNKMQNLKWKNKYKIRTNKINIENKLLG